MRAQVLQQLRSAMGEVNQVEASPELRAVVVRWVCWWLLASAVVVSGLAIAGRWEIGRWWTGLKWWAPISVVLTLVVIVAWVGWSLYTSGVCVFLLRKGSSPRRALHVVLASSVVLYVAIAVVAVVVPGVWPT